MRAQVKFRLLGPPWQMLTIGYQYLCLEMTVRYSIANFCPYARDEVNGSPSRIMKVQGALSYPIPHPCRQKQDNSGEVRQTRFCPCSLYTVYNNRSTQNEQKKEQRHPRVVGSASVRTRLSSSHSALQANCVLWVAL